jgi:drug/metabolite transporter (DMT)-like permease
VLNPRGSNTLRSHANQLRENPFSLDVCCHRMPSHRLTAYLCLATGMTITGSYVALSKPLVAALPVFVLAGLRFAIAALAMLPWTRALPSDAPLSAHDKLGLFAQSFFGNFLFSVCMLYGVSLTSASAAGVIFATIPAAVAALSWVYLKETPTRRTLIAIALSVCGLVVLQFAKADAASNGAPQPLLGNALILGAVFCEAVYVVLGRQLAGRVSPKRISALINLCGLTLVAPFAVWQGIGFAKIDGFAAVSGLAWATLVYYALAASVVSVWLWMKGSQTVPANEAGVFTLALPLTATLIGVLGFGEAFTATHALAFALAIAGLVLIVTAKPRV